MEDNTDDKKNRNFVQIYRDNMPELRWLMINHSFASGVLFFILEHMDGRNALACSYELMSDYFGKNRSTLHRAIKLLEENGFISILKMGTSNVYIVNTEIAWTSYNNQKTGVDTIYAKLDGKVLISKKENKDYTLRLQNNRFKALGERINNKKNN